MTINQAILCGNLTRDPEKKGTEDNPVLSFTIAVNDFANGAETVGYFDCAVFGKRAAALAKVLHKGLKVCVTGRLHYSTWETKDGSKRAGISVYVNDLEFMSSRNVNIDEEVPW